MEKRLTVESREPPPMATMLEDIAEVGPLLWGDYSWITQTGLAVGIERKHVTDLLSNLFENLPNQLIGLHECYDIPILLIEGVITRSYSGHCKIINVDHAGVTSTAFLGHGHKNGELHVNYISYANALLQLQKLAYVTWSDNLKGSADRIRGLIHLLDGSHKSDLLREHIIRREASNLTYSTKERNYVRLLMGLPGISEVRARAILREYSSPYLFFEDCALNGKCKVKGIGSKMIEEICEALGEIS